jgi:hypothetical protein
VVGDVAPGTGIERSGDGMGIDSGRDIHDDLIPVAVPPFASREPGGGAYRSSHVTATRPP